MPNELPSGARRLLGRGFGEAHRVLARYHARRGSLALPSSEDAHDLSLERRAGVMELELLAAERTVVAPLAHTAPRDGDGLVAWFERLATYGPGQGDPLFVWLAGEATRGELAWFMGQDLAADVPIADVLALTRLDLPESAKLALAHTHWDEMGRGTPARTRQAMTGYLGAELGRLTSLGEIVLEAHVRRNLVLALARHRAWAWHALGALAAGFVAAPRRWSQIAVGMARTDVSVLGLELAHVRETLATRHAELWLREVVRALVAAAPELAVPLAEGALIRLAADARCFARLRKDLAFASGARPYRDWAAPRIDDGLS